MNDSGTAAGPAPIRRMETREEAESHHRLKRKEPLTWRQCGTETERPSPFDRSHKATQGEKENCRKARELGMPWCLGDKEKFMEGGLLKFLLREGRPEG